MEVWNELVTWAQQEGGHVHKDLELRTISRDHRGVFVKENRKIPKGHVLIRLPESLAIHGGNLPDSYDSRQASTWLRCIAAYLQHDVNSPYSRSLPDKYETLWQWEDEEIKLYLSGVHPIGSDSWKMDEKTVEQRFETQIRPFLKHCQIPIDETTAVSRFVRACQTVSTRGFHMKECTDTYAGPFLLPVMDLMNHSIQEACTTLQRQNEYFVMIAERDIEANEEALHSYGDGLTNSQFLTTFGFVPRESIRNPLPSPVVVSKEAVFQSCWDVIESRLPEQIASSMSDQALEDEAWTVSVDRLREARYVPDVILVDGTLNDELVTASCVHFLPKCAYSEISSTTLLDKYILEDYFLGKLVGSALIKMIQRQLERYIPIPHDVRQSLEMQYAGSDDAKLLDELLQDNDTSGHSIRRQRLLAGLAIREDEKRTFSMLLQEAMKVLNYLEGGDEEAVGKRYKSAL